MGNQKPVYLDYHSTTPVDPGVLEAMLPFFSVEFGNPASRSHPYGWRASEAVELSRERVASLLAVDKSEIVFTSGATEGLNFVIKGLAEVLEQRGRHMVTASTEHQAVLDSVGFLEDWRGYLATRLKVDRTGMLNLDQLNDSIRDDTLMVIVMWANNETGVIQQMRDIGKICTAKNVPFICDATQAVGKLTVHPKENEIDFLVLSGHKMYGPKGVGAVYIAKNQKKLKPEALIHGGGHEGGYRSGTLNVPGIVGLGYASTLFQKDGLESMQRLGVLRDRFERQILNSLESVEINGSAVDRLPTVSNFRAAYVDSQAVMTKLRTKISISSGSACSSAKPEPSHVLLAMGLTHEQAKSSFRVSLGRQTTEEEIDFAAASLIEAITEYRSQSPVWQMFKSGIPVDGKEP